MKRNLFVRIMCIFLAILMLGGVVIGAIQAFAFGPETMNIAATGDSNTKNIIIIVAVVAVLILLGVTVAPKLIEKFKK